MSDPALRRGASVFRIPTVCQALDEEHHLPISRKVYLMGSGFSGIEASSSTFQCKFPPFGAKSAHPSVNLPGIPCCGATRYSNREKEPPVSAARARNVTMVAGSSETCLFLC